MVTSRVTLPRMVGPKRPGPAPLPAAEKRSEAIALVKVTPGERRELEAWAERTHTPIATLLREAGLAAARLPHYLHTGVSPSTKPASRKPRRSQRK